MRKRILSSSIFVSAPFVCLIGLTSLVAGCSGSSGATGATGATGAKGATGATGPEGPAGEAGAPGAEGPAGPTGPEGPAGEAGAPAPGKDAGPLVAPNAVYMLSNDATQNEIIAFARAANGSLTPFGSFPTGGAGTGAGLGDQGALAFDGTHNLFFAVNAGDNSISELQLEADGSISLLSKIASGGVAPNSITFNGSTVYVLNSGSAPAGENPGSAPNITGFTVEPGGLVALKNSTASLSGPASVGGAEILFVAGGSALVVTERLANNIDVFALTAGVPASTTPTTVFAEPGPSDTVPGSEPFGFSLTAGGQIVVSEAWSGTAGISSSSTFSVTAAGALTEISKGVTNGQSGACWTTVVGNYAYETNTASGTVSQYAIAANGTMTVVGTGLAGTAGGTGAGSTDLTASADGKYLYVHNGTGALSIFSISATDGTLTKLSDFEGIPAHAEGLVAR